MNSLVTETREARADTVLVSKDSLTIDLTDGRTIIAPLVWYPRLWHGTVQERSHFEIVADGTLIHWPDLDEDLSVAGVLAGHRSGEGHQSLKRWLEQRSGHGRRNDEVKITHAQQIFAAVATLVGKRPSAAFTRDEVRRQAAVSRREWDASYSPVFQGMRVDQPGGAPNVPARFRGVFQQVSHGKHQLSEKGQRVLRELP